MKDINTPPVEKIIKDGKNKISQFLTEGEVFTNCKLINTNPFIVETNKGNIFLTNNSEDEIPINSEYALLNSRKLRKKISLKTILI